MWAFMTTGTAHFLKDLTESHPEINFHFMRSGVSTLVYYESKKKKSIFVSGRSFNILKNDGVLNEKGFVVMDFIPVTEEGMDIFEEKTKQQFSIIENTNGLITLKLLKQLKKNTYVILSQWETERHYKNWQKSDEYEQANFANLARLPAYFAERPFTSTYYMVKEEDE